MKGLIRGTAPNNERSLTIGAALEARGSRSLQVELGWGERTNARRGWREGPR